MTAKLLGLAIISTLLVGCGDPDMGAPDTDTRMNENDSTTEQANHEPETRTIQVSGTVIFEGPVDGVQVCADLKKTVTCNSADPSTTTNEDGSYELSWESQAPHLDYNLIASWPRDPFAEVAISLAPTFETTTIGARDIHNGIINPLTTSELHVRHQMRLRDYSESEQEEGLDELRNLFAEIYDLPADDVYSQVTESEDYVEVMGIQNRLNSHTIGLVTDPLAPAHVTRHLKDELLTEIKANNESVYRFFIKESNYVKERVRQTLVELGYLTED